ncbi:glycosyl transferase [Microbacterium capsulatum]|uniref:Glycosyl transferase n=1 Tax=Microbacterium capsulatum TaxID=3041921 RepID=A0ABU0XMT9_9MICO|nr:glycosyl transferase [Microbacterium sp. ASV81]MDQ4215400.1 glycosyl transferase [Microbacterium sp. ASV81]
MSARVHAVLVARSGATSLARLLRALDAIAAQTRRPDALTIVACGPSSAVRTSARVAAAAEAVVETKSSTTLAAAVALAVPRVADGSALWILTEDCVPDPDALEHLAGALERSPSSVAAAPKLLSEADDRRIVSFGQSMTRFGRTVDPARGELDQGQHDAQDDALGADVRGLLLREARAVLPDPGLSGRDEGLDIGVRARLGGGRIVLTAGARIAVDEHAEAAGTAADAYAVRRAQLHRRLSYAPTFAVPLHWLSLLPLALWRSIAHLTGKRPAAVLPEWGAAAVAMVSGSAVSRSRRGIRAGRVASWSSIAPLRVTRAQLRQRLDDGHGSEAGVHEELGFFSGGGAWAVLAALVLGIGLFTSLLAWPALGGGALLPLRQTVAALWRDAAYGQRGFGVDVVGPADPFSGVIAVLGSLWPGAPSYSLVLLWVAALPLAMLGGWFAATRITDKAGLRIFAGTVWALAPTFLIALGQGRPAAVLFHLLLPWVLHAALVAHRSWGAAGAASLLTVAALACAPSLAPAFALLWLVAIVWLLARRAFRGAVRMVWVLVPAVVLFAPLAIWQLAHGDLLALFSDPGAIVAAPQATADAAGRLSLLAGLPTMEQAGWPTLLQSVLPGVHETPWALWLAAPLAVLALISTISPRWSVGIGSVVVAATGLATAFAAVGISVAFAQSTAVPIWPGAALSLTGIGVLGGALVTLDGVLPLPALRTAAALIAAAAVAVAAVPSGVALVNGDAAIHRGELSTLPAYVTAQARDDRDLGTLVLTVQANGGLATTVVWGASATLGAQATILTTATAPRGHDLAGLSVDLVSARQFDAPAALGTLGVRYVLLQAGTPKESDAERALRLQSATALDQRAGFVRVGETARGVLWRMEAVPAARASLTDAQGATSRVVTAIELIVLLAALLLALPTRASRRAAHAVPRAIGVLPERAPRAPRPPKEPRAPRARRGPKAAPQTASVVIPGEPIIAERVLDADAAPDLAEPAPGTTSAPEAGLGEAETATTDPEAADPEAADPEAADLEAEDPEAADPEAEDPETEDPKGEDPGTETADEDAAARPDPASDEPEPGREPSLQSEAADADHPHPEPAPAKEAAE